MVEGPLDLTEDELRQLADAGDGEAQEAVDELDAEREAVEAPSEDELEAIAEAEAELELDRDPPGPVTGDRLDDARADMYRVYIGDAIKVGAEKLRVRMVHGRGVVSVQDGRRFKPGDYERLT